VYAPSADVAAFEIRTFHFLRQLVEQHDVACDWTSTTGAHGFFSRPLFDAAAAHLARTEAQDPSLAGAARAITPQSSSPSLGDLGLPPEAAVGAMWQANAAALWPYKLVAWVLEDLLARFAWRGGSSGGGSNGNEGVADDETARGFNLQTNTPVTHLQPLERPGSGGWIVHTPRGQVAASRVLVASNAYVSQLLPDFSDLIVPVRGQVAALVPPDGTPNPLLRHTYVFLAEADSDQHEYKAPTGETGQVERTTNSCRRDHDMDDYLVQRPSPVRELIFGGGRDYATAPTVGVSDDDEIDPATSAHLKAILPQVLDLHPSTGDDHVEAEKEKKKNDAIDAVFEWSGIMGFSRDGHPWVGRVPSSVGGGNGLWLCAGYTGHGMPQAALCAKAVVEMMGGTDYGDIDLPRSFFLTDERIHAARNLDEVRVADTKGIGLFSPMDELFGIGV
jgi:glycine/D-amino acid oxidase-like deaminating enzyme